MVNRFSHIFLFLFSIISIEIFCLQPLNGQISDYKRYSNPSIEKSDAYNKGNVYQKDFLLFINILQECHPAFAHESSYPFNIDSIKQAGYQWGAGECHSIKNLWVYIQAIATLLNDGHTTLMPEIDTNIIYPVMYFIDDQDIYIVGINKEYKSSLGKQISNINGYPADDVIRSFKQLISSDNEIYFKNKVIDFMQLYSMWQYTPYCLPDSSLKLTFTDTTSTSIRPIAKSKINIVSPQPQAKHESIRGNNRIPFHYTMIPKKDICYLQFNSCIDQNSLRSQYLLSNPNMTENDLGKKISQYPRFDMFLSEMFDTIRANNISTLVVDVRNNTGGNSKLCNELLSWLKPVKSITVTNSYIRFSELWKQHYPALAARYEHVFAEIQQPLEMGKLYNSYTLPNLSESSMEKKPNEYFLMNNDESLIFKGNVIFIQNSKTYSSAGMLITAAIDNNVGIVIGDKSSYRPCNYGDILAWELPNTKIRGFVSYKIFNRPNIAKCSEDYLLPTVYLHPDWKDVVEAKDVYWEWILKNYMKIH
jgi:hypothetical protein